MDDVLQFLMQHGTVVLFTVVLAEQIGLPIPALPFLIAAGALVGTGHLSLGMATVAAVAAAGMGDQLWFELGRRRGRTVLNWLCRISFEPTACVRRTEEFFARHGAYSLIVAKFIPGLSTVAPPLAGVMGLSTSQYLLYNGIGTVLWVGSGIGLGLLFSDRLDEAGALAAHLGPGIGLALLGSLIGYVVYKVWHRSRLGRLMPRRTVQQVREQIASGEELTFVDLRPDGARNEVPGIPGSLALSVEDLLAGHHALPGDRDVILYCACPGDATSVQAASRLRDKGLMRVWPLAGGIEAWHTFDRQAQHTLSESGQTLQACSSPL